MGTVITPSTSGARNILVMIEFLLVILIDIPKDFIYHGKLFDLLARVGALTSEVSTLARGLEEKSRNKESSDETNHATLDLLENIELVKEDLKHVYLKAPDSSQCCFPMTNGPLFIHLLLLHLNDLLDSNAYSIALIKEEIGLMKEDLTFIRSSLIDVEQQLYKDLWPRVLDVAYEAKNAIDSIIVRDNDLDVISIIGMPGSGKTTLAYKVYNDKSVSSHFDLRAWCTVDQANDKKEFLKKVFNQVTGSDSNYGNNLFGKRYPIVLDDLWDIESWDELTRPFPEVEKGSRIILTTRQKEVALHGKRHCDPLNLRLLRTEESWELLEKRVFGKESCPDELLDVGKEIARNCKGLPLVADLIAEVVAGLEKKKTVWLEIQSNLSSFILNSEVDVMKDTTVGVDILKENWHAEGLVERTEMKSVKEGMGTYFDNLISSSLVILFSEIEVEFLPSSFSNLWNLDMLKVEKRGSNLVLLPRIWDLVKLRVLSVDACSFFDLDANEPILIAENSKLENLRYLEKLTLSYLKDIEDIFKRFPNLHRLYFVLKESWDYSTGLYWFPKLDFLTELESLTIEFESSNTNDILDLFDFPLTSDSLSTIGRLPNLEEMFLYRTIIQGEEWNMGEEDTFVKLQYLGLYEVNLAKWEVREESFPVLETLKLKECPKLEEIPPSFGDIYSLKIIKLVKSPQLEDSAKNIKEYVEEMTGEDKLQILGPKNIPLFKKQIIGTNNIDLKIQNI
ncbi:unnamed protein product [Withania somnifera]